jgi:enoyl-CoA hydratase
MEMLLVGDPITATDAARMGLVNTVVPAGRALDEAIAGRGGSPSNRP